MVPSDEPVGPYRVWFGPEVLIHGGVNYLETESHGPILFLSLPLEHWPTTWAAGHVRRPVSAAEG